MSRALPRILFRVATDRATEIDGLIEGHAQHWRMERMAAVDRNLMRAAVAELLGFPDTPRAVVINEALEIARKFSSPESVQFINGVLDSVGKELESSRSQSSVVGRQSSANQPAQTYIVPEWHEQDARAHIAGPTTDDRRLLYGLTAIRSGLQVKVTPCTGRPGKSWHRWERKFAECRRRSGCPGCAPGRRRRRHRAGFRRG